MAADRSTRRSDRRARGRRGRSRAARRRCAARLAPGRRRSSTAGTRRGRVAPPPVAWSVVTANEMLRSDDPCAIATTLMPPVDERREHARRDARRAGHAVADDRDDRHARPRGDVVDEAGGQLVAKRGAQALDGRASASASGSVKPIELSEDAWKIVETDSRSRVDGHERARRDAVHADHALAGDGDDRLAAHDRDRLDRVGRVRAFAPTLPCPAASGWMNDRTCSMMRVPAIGMSARGCRTLAP